MVMKLASEGFLVSFPGFVVEAAITPIVRNTNANAARRKFRVFLGSSDGGGPEDLG